MDFIWLDSYSLRICVFIITTTITILFIRHKRVVDPDDDPDDEIVDVCIWILVLLVTIFLAITLTNLKLGNIEIIHPVAGIFLSVGYGILTRFCLDSKSLTVYTIIIALFTLGIEQFSAQKIQYTLLEIYTKQELTELTWSDKTEIYIRYKNRIEEIREKRQLEKINARINMLEQQ